MSDRKGDLDDIGSQLLAVSDWLEDINRRLRERGYAVLAHQVDAVGDAVGKVRLNVADRAKEQAPN